MGGIAKVCEAISMTDRGSYVLGFMGHKGFEGITVTFPEAEFQYDPYHGISREREDDT